MTDEARAAKLVYFCARLKEADAAYDQVEAMRAHAEALDRDIEREAAEYGISFEEIARA